MEIDTRPRSARYQLSPNLTHVRDTLGQITHDLAPHHTPDFISSAELVIAEVLNNIVEHAFAEAQAGHIEIELRPSEDGLKCIICDTGHPMPNLRPPSGQGPRILSKNNPPEGGFGWLIIRSLTRGLSYERRQSKNHLSFLIPTQERLN